MSNIVKLKPKRPASRYRFNMKLPANDRSTVLHVRLPASLVQRLKKTAAANFRTMTQETHLRLVRDLDKNK